jgi:DNA-binding NarL/FixJ family response regulator
MSRARSQRSRFQTGEPQEFLPGQAQGEVAAFRWQPGAEVWQDLQEEVLGDLDLYQLAGLGETALETARSCDYRAGEGFALNMAGPCLCRAGAYGRGLEFLGRALSIAEEIEHRELATSVHLTWGIELYTGLSVSAQAREHLEVALAAARELESVTLTLIATAHLAAVCILQNDMERAQTLLDGVLPAGLPEFTGMTFLLRRCWAARAELDLARGQPVRALEIIDRLLAATANLAQYGPQAVPRLSQLRGQALRALGQIAKAVEEFQGALIVAAARGEQPMIWRLHADLGHAYRALRRHEAAEEAFASARAMIQQLADTVTDEALRENFLKQALATMPAAPVLGPRQAARKALGGLSERERQVAALVAQGQSNHEIAQTLNITKRTVEAHITRIFDRLGLKSRAQIAAWAVAQGLVKPHS